MNHSLNYFYYNKKEKVILKDVPGEEQAERVKPDVVLGFAANLDTWGYYLDEECIARLLTLSEKSVVDFYNDITWIIKDIKGDDVSHDNFLFKNFPDSCRSIDIDELSTSRFISYYAAYWDYLFASDYYHSIKWDGEVAERKQAEHNSDQLRKISLGSEEDFCKMCRNFLAGRMSLSGFEKECLEFSFANFSQSEIIPDKVPYKENWAFLIKESMDGKIEYDFEFKTFTDFIRACAALSDGDISLSEKPIIRYFDKNERRMLLEKLDKSAEKYPEDFTQSLMTKRNSRFYYNILQKGWHVKATDKRYPHLSGAWSEARQNYSTMSLAEQALENKEYYKAASIYAEKSPGDLLRRINALLCKAEAEDKGKIIELIKEKAGYVSPAVLLNAKNALFIDNKTKTAFIKGNTAKVFAFENDKFLDAETADIVGKILQDAIKEQLSHKKPMGRVYIDENLKYCPVPFAGRNDTGKNRSVERGTRLPKKSKSKIIRAFCYKKNSFDGFYDLSASFVSDTFDLIEMVSWTQLKSSNTGKPIAVHSGDDSNCSIGCTEFIDIDLDEIDNLNKKNSKPIRYIAFQVFAWNRIPFSRMERVFFGIMERNSMTSDKITDRDLKILKGKLSSKSSDKDKEYYYQLSPEELSKVMDYKQEVVFDPATVEYRFDLTGNSLCKVPLLYDCKDEKYIFTDIDAMRSSPFIKAVDKRNESSNVPYDIIFKNYDSKALLVEDFIGPVTAACNAVVNIEKPDLYSLFNLVAEATGSTVVDNMKEADVIMSVDRIDSDKHVITPFDRDEIIAGFLTP